MRQNKDWYSLIAMSSKKGRACQLSHLLSPYDFEYQEKCELTCQIRGESCGQNMYDPHLCGAWHCERADGDH